MLPETAAGVNVKLNRALLAPGAVTALGVLAGCDYIAPATPGPVARTSALSGTHDPIQRDCREVDQSLVIDGNRFGFPNATCMVANSERHQCSIGAMIGPGM